MSNTDITNIAHYCPGARVIGVLLGRRRGPRLGPKRASLASPEHQVTGCAAGLLGLGLVARAGEARPGLPPVVGALGGPAEIGRAEQPLERPLGVVRPVRDHWGCCLSYAEARGRRQSRVPPRTM